MSHPRTDENRDFYRGAPRDECDHGYALDDDELDYQSVNQTGSGFHTRNCAWCEREADDERRSGR